MNEVRVTPEAVAAKIAGQPVARFAYIPQPLLDALVGAGVADLTGPPGAIAEVKGDHGPADVALALVRKLVDRERNARVSGEESARMVERCRQELREWAEKLRAEEEKVRDRAEEQSRARAALEILISGAGASIEVEERPAPRLCRECGAILPAHRPNCPVPPI